MPRQPECNCEPCVRRRATNLRWHNKPDVKERRLKATADRAKEKRAASRSLKFCRVCGVDITGSCLYNRLCPSCQADLPPVPPARPARPPKRIEPTDEELDARALASMPENAHG